MPEKLICVLQQKPGSLMEAQAIKRDKNANHSAPNNIATADESNRNQPGVSQRGTFK